MRIITVAILFFIIFQYSCNDASAKKFKPKAHSGTYIFCKNYDADQSICGRITVPKGFERIPVKGGSFEEWLRGLPLKPKGASVHLYNGKLKGNQNVHAAIIDIDAGNTDLQQCADAVIRLRAEYLYSMKDYDKLHFNFTNGFHADFKKWSQGYRIRVKGNAATWVKTTVPNDSYQTFKEYLNVVFNYAGTSSLSKELVSVSDLEEIQIGDVFIYGGFPGHAVLVSDLCKNKTTGEKLFLIQQSYMPAQEIHILKNYNDPDLSPWYSIHFKGDLETPEWTFKKEQLKRFSQ